MVGGYGAGAPDGEGRAGGTEGDILVPLPLPADKRTELFLGNGQGGDQKSALDPNAFLGLTSSAGVKDTHVTDGETDTLWRK